jgi:hypothetical protein
VFLQDYFRIDFLQIDSTKKIEEVYFKMEFIVKVFAAHKSIKKPMPLILQKIKNEENNLKRQNKTLKNLIQCPNIVFIIKKTLKNSKKITWRWHLL